MKMAKYITLKANKNPTNKNKKIFTTHNEYLFYFIKLNYFLFYLYKQAKAIFLVPIARRRTCCLKGLYIESLFLRYR